MRTLPLLLGIFTLLPMAALATDYFGTTQVIQTPTGPKVIMLSPPTAQLVRAPAAGGTTDNGTTDSGQKSAVGYDAKAKRDANGKIIEGDKTQSAPAADPYALRTDQGLRNDNMLNKQ